MKDCLMIDYDAFAMDSRICVLKDNKVNQYIAASSIPELAQAVVDAATRNNIYEARIHSPLAFMTELKNQVEQIETKTYANHKINIEVME